VQLTIIGAGAIGGTIGAHLLRDGHEVTLCDADAAHVDAINRRGLVIEGPVEQFTVEARAITPDQLPDRLEHAAVAVKSHHTSAAAELLRRRLDPDGWVVTFQNGLTAETLAAAVGVERLIVSFVNFGADVLGPGRILQGNVGTFRVGEPDGRISPRVEALASALPYAVATDNILGYLWGKEAYGAMLWAGAVSDLSIADSLEDPRWRPLMLAVAREVLAQAPVRPEAFDGFDPEDLEGSLGRLVKFNRTSAKSHSGIYRDLMVRRRKTEVEDLLHDLEGPLTTLTGELIRAIERDERTCEVANLELLAAYERVLRIGPALDALVRVLPAPARRRDGPLHGMPVAVKDMIDVIGVPRGNGNPSDMAGPPATADAAVVTALRNAGAEVFAMASLLEYAAGAVHPAVPEARNPFDPARTAGGSSGGSAALVGALACPLAVGTDTGGSIRIPAHYCGVVGLKPTFGAIDPAGVQALAPTLDHVGLIGVDVATTAAGFAAVTGATPPSPPGRVRIGLGQSSLAHPALAPDVDVVLRAAIGRLSGAFEVTDVDDSALLDIVECLEDLILWEAWQVHGEMVTAEPGRYGPETLRLLRAGAQVTAEAYDAAGRRRDGMLAAVHAAYTGVDLLLTPAAPFTAPATTPPVDTPQGAAEGLFTASHNLTGCPAVVVPCGWSESGLPVGLQLSATRGADLHLLACAAAVESVLAFERPPELTGTVAARASSVPGPEEAP
jgi:2-dehydropantoate 2-reductase